MQEPFFDKRKTLFLVLSAFIAAGCGVIATVLTSRAIDNYAARLLDDRRFTALAPQKPVTAPGTYEESLTVLREDTWRSLAVFMPASVDTAVPRQWMAQDDAQGTGVVVSADGWVLASDDAVPQNFVPRDHEVWVAGERYTIERVVRDDASPLVLLKLAQAAQLPAVGFGAAEDVQSGELLFALHEVGVVTPLPVKNAELELLSGVQKAEEVTTTWQLSQAAFGEPLFSPSGELMGFGQADLRAFPFHHSGGFVQDIVRSNSVKRASVGMYIMDLSRAFNVASTVRQDRSLGALVIAPGGVGTAVVPQGPADKAGILSGDIILDVDGELITREQTLAEILLDYDPGEIANMRILRNGVASVVPVTLGSLDELSY